jgi:hypothetical protein
MINRLAKDILVVTPTLGTRESLKVTSDSIKKCFPERVHHIVTGPKSLKEKILLLAPGSEFVPEVRNEGVYTAINDIFKTRASEYKYIAYINDDDYWLPGYRHLIKILDDNSSIDLAYGRTLWVNESGETLSNVAHFPFGKCFVRLIAHGIPIFTQQAVLMRSKLYFRLGGFNESYKLVSDTDFWARAVISEAKIMSTNTLCACYSKHPDQLSNNYSLVHTEHFQMLQNLRIKKHLFSLISVLLFKLYNIFTYFSRIFKS